MRFNPRSFAGRLSLYFVAAVSGAQLLAFIFFMHETSRLDRTVIRLRLGEQVETLVRLIDALPPDAAAKAVAVYRTPRHHYDISNQSSLPPDPADPDIVRLTERMHERVGGAVSDIRLAPGDSNKGEGVSGQVALLLSVHLRDGRWLNASFMVPSREPSWMRIGLYQIAASLIAVLAVVGHSRAAIVRPLTALTDMARRLGQGTAVPVLPERGLEEVRVLTAAFNTMQERLRTFVADRTQMLAAIGHDLRTPIASLWLRAEMIEEETLRAAMIASIRQMGEMVDATLAFAKAEVVHPAWQMVDLAQLAAGVVEEHRILGEDVVLTDAPSLPVEADAAMMRRAIDNLVTNAVRYGTSARVRLVKAEASAIIRVEDDGPGIPPEMLQEVLKPFVRLDRSRGDHTSGVGLGLAVVQSAVRVHGGKLFFRNGEQSGLIVEIALTTGARSSAL